MTTFVFATMWKLERNCFLVLIYRSSKIFCTGLCALSMLITLNRVNWSPQEEHVSQFSSDEQLHSNYMEDKYFNDLIDMAGHIQLSGYLYIFRLFSLCLICLFLSKIDLSNWISSLVVGNRIILEVRPCFYTLFVTVSYFQYKPKINLNDKYVNCWEICLQCLSHFYEQVVNIHLWN